MDKLQPWYLTGNDPDENWIVHSDMGNAGEDYAVTVYLRGGDVEEQAERLVALLNRVAPDGVLPTAGEGPAAS